MRGEKIEVAGPHQGRWHAHAPAPQNAGIREKQRVEDQWWQRKIINPVGLIAITEIAQILLIWQVGLGDDDSLIIINIGDVADKLNDCMCLAQIETAGSGFLPQKTHRIEAQDTNTVINKIENNADEFLKQERIGKIKINLILAEGTPDFLFPADRCHRLQ